jgi:hypothetical protein
VGLATAWGGSAHANTVFGPQDIQLTITPNKNLSHVYFFYVTNRTGSTSIPVPLPDLTANVPTVESFVIQNGTSNTNAVYCYLTGVYDETNQLVTLDFSNGTAAGALGKTFEQEFPGITESAFAAALETGDTNTLSGFFSDSGPGARLGPTLGDSGQLVNFSTGTAGGTIATAVIPEPACILLTSFGVLTILAFKRKRSH